MEIRFDGKIVFIIGVGSGIGEVIVKVFVEVGVYVFILECDVVKGEVVVQMICEIGGKVDCEVVDVSQ